MPRTKRKDEEEEDDFDFGSDAPSSTSQSGQSDVEDDDMDIFNSLVGPSSRSKSMNKDDDRVFDEDEDEEDGVAGFIQSQLDKRKMKDGMDVVKNVSKGKQSSGKSLSGGGSFQSMGLHPELLRAVLLHGYKVPTPIQRAAIPTLLASPPRDLVGMARTGSGKTLAYMIPLVNRLGGRHSIAFGSRALILVPTRELALQVMKSGKELSRGWHRNSGGRHAGDAPDSESAKNQNLRWGLIVGGESMDQQFRMIADNPDVIVATPGRLLHIAVEMNLELHTINFVVFDEADRLFEMGFAAALTEILKRLPTTRQTLLFSATLPENIVEFAKAGLQDPKLVRLDAESKVSTDLRMAFFSVKDTEKDAALLTLLREVIKVPHRASDKKPEEPAKGKGGKKAKEKGLPRQLAPHQTLIFTATKHHAEYLSSLLSAAGYLVSYIYGSLDQTARRLQMESFRKGTSDLLVVTDVAARGIDIPVLEHVVNYDFPHSAKVFVHRVGRTARAGRQGWAYSFISFPELPHLLDLQLFLGKEIQTNTSSDDGEAPYTSSLVLGTFPRGALEDTMDEIRVLETENSSLVSQREVMERGHKLYLKTKAKASQPSFQRAKEMMKSDKWGLAGSPGEGSAVQPIFALKGVTAPSGSANDAEDVEKKRQGMLKAIGSFNPSETVFEIGSRGKQDGGAQLMKNRRNALEKAVKRQKVPVAEAVEEDEDDVMEGLEFTAASSSTAGPARKSFQDPDFYLPYQQEGASITKGYSLTDGTSFAENARHAAFSLADDETRSKSKPGKVWDKSKRRFVGAGEGSDNVKMIRTENGTKLPATYRSGRFDDWKRKNHVRLPRAGEEELEGRQVQTTGRQYKHNQMKEPKPLDPKQVDYERKVRRLKKKAAEASEELGDKPRIASKVRQVKNELKSAETIRKDRKTLEKKKSRYGRPSRKKKGVRS